MFSSKFQAFSALEESEARYYTLQLLQLLVCVLQKSDYLSFFSAAKTQLCLAQVQVECGLLRLWAEGR